MLYFCYRTLLPPCLHHSQTGRPTAWRLIHPVLPPGHQHTRIAPTLVQARRPSGSPWEDGAAGWHVLTPGQKLAGPQRPGETGPLVSPVRHAPTPHRSRQAQSTGRLHGTLRPWHLPVRVWEAGAQEDPHELGGIHLPGRPFDLEQAERGTHPSLLPPIAGHLHPLALM